MVEKRSIVDLAIDITKNEIVPITLLKPNTWNPKEKDTDDYFRVKKSIMQHGQKAPIVIRRGRPDEPFDYLEIIDGEQRYTALVELGVEKVAIYDEGLISDQLAKELTVAHQQQVPFDDVEHSNLISQMLEEYSDLLLPYDDNDLQMYKDLASFDYKEEYKDMTADFEEGVKTFKVVMETPRYDYVMAVLQKLLDTDEAMSLAQALEFVVADFASSH